MLFVELGLKIKFINPTEATIALSQNYTPNDIHNGIMKLYQKKNDCEDVEQTGHAGMQGPRRRLKAFSSRLSLFCSCDVVMFISTFIKKASTRVFMQCQQHLTYGS